MKKYKNISIIEDHSSVGGLSSIVKEALYSSRINTKVNFFSLKDKFFKSYGSQEQFWRKHGIDENKIVSIISQKK